MITDDATDQVLVKEELRPASPKVTNMDTGTVSILMKLDAAVVARLFGSGPWLADLESGPALSRVIAPMGLQEQVPGTMDAWKLTPLGKQVNSDLIMVFLGM